MTLDEAIKHCLDIADGQDKCAEISVSEHAKERISQCATDHRQLAEWLTELKQWRRVYGVCPSYEMCIPECKEGYNAQTAEYKRLLKAAVEDLNSIGRVLEGNDILCMKYIACKGCPFDGDNCNKWRYADEALALIGEDTNVPASADDTNVDHKSGSWISCEDRLPKENILVLCYARSTTGEGNSCFLGAIVHGEFWFLQVNDIGHVSFPVPHWEVTHWQPLPKSPKDGEQNE